MEEEFKKLWNMDVLEPEKESTLTPDEELALKKFLLPEDSLVTVMR
jgi:hypothetical protein